MYKRQTYNSPHTAAKARAKAKGKEKAKEKEKEKAKAKAKAKAKNGTYMPIKHQTMTTGRTNHSYTTRISERIMELRGAKQKAALNQQKDTLSA